MTNGDHLVAAARSGRTNAHRHPIWTLLLAFAASLSLGGSCGEGADLPIPGDPGDGSGRSAQGPPIHEADLGHGLRLRWWRVGEQRVGRTEFAYTFSAMLASAAGATARTIVSIASSTTDSVLEDAALLFPSVAAGEEVASADTFVIRQDRRAPFDPSALRFRALDRFGGDLSISAAATGRFYLAEIDGHHWLITPEGHAFFSSGVNHITWHGDYSPPIDRRPYHEAVLAKYGTEEAWADATEDRLRGWNVNTVGAWSNDHSFPTMPYTPILSLHQAAPEVPGWPTGQTGKAIRDYFDPRFEAGVAARAQRAVKCAAEPYCIGVFSDNELPFGQSVLQFETYVDAYLTLPAGAPGKLELQAFFEERYANDIDAMNAAWSLSLASFDDIQQLEELADDDPYCNVAERRADRQAFVARAAARYFEVIDAALHAISPELLFLGTRFLAVYTAPGIYEAAAPYVDVISINDYDWDENGRGLFKSEGEPLGYLFLDDPVTDLETVHSLTGKPLMIGEWTVRTPTPGADVLFPPFMPTAETQEERADWYQWFMDELHARPYVVGAHWFKFHDQPATGRGDGENSLFGTVNIDDDRYPELTERMAAVNARHYDRPASADGGSGGGATSGPPLGVRRLSIAAPQSGRTGFYIFIQAVGNLAEAVVGGPIVMEAGVPDENDVAPLRLVEDTVIAYLSVAGDIACLKLRAEGSSGELACSGGFAHDVSVSMPTGTTEGLAPTTEAFLGEDAGPGAATLLVPVQFAHLPAGSVAAECVTTDSYGREHLAAFTTAKVTSTKGATSVDALGESFSCGADGLGWRTEDSPGMFAVGMPIYDTRVPNGDLASAFTMADSELACIP